MVRHGENIHKRKDGRWEARYIRARKPNGKAIYRSVYGASYTEARTKRLKEQVNLESVPLLSNFTFAQVVDMWLNSKKDHIKPSSYNQYFNQSYHHLIPDLGDMAFSSLREDDVNLFLKKKLSEGYSNSTIQCFRTIFMMVFRYARKNHIICNVNDEIFMPRQKRKQIEVFTRKEQLQINEYLHAHPSPFSLSIYLSLYCGLRIGEVCALQWKDIHIKKETITISKTLIRLQNLQADEKKKTSLAIQCPKTDSSIRTIPIPSFLVPLLNESRMDDDTYVITGKKTGIEPRVCLRKFKAIIRKIGIGDYTFHACRHTFATRSIEVGMDPKTLSELLGHSNVKTTLDRYVHPSLEQKREQINKLNNLTKNL